MNEWTPLEAEIYKRGATESFGSLSKRFDITSVEVKIIYEKAHAKFQTFDEGFRNSFNNHGGANNKWTDEEWDILRDAARRDATYAEVVSLLPKRRPYGIVEKYARIRHELGVKTRTTWTKEDDKALLQMRDQGVGAVDLAVRMNRSVGFISNKLRVLTGETGKNSRSWSPEELDIIENAVKRGMIAKQICEALPGRSWNAIALRMNERREVLGIPKPSKRWSLEDEQEVIAGVLRGEEHAEIGKRLGRSEGSVSGKVKLLKMAGMLPDVDGRRAF